MSPGRHRAWWSRPSEDFCLPLPDYVIGDVGTSLYRVRDGSWSRVSDWEEIIGADWAGLTAVALAALFEDLPELRLQESEKQGRYKLSYYAPAHDLDPGRSWLGCANAWPAPGAGEPRLEHRRGGRSACWTCCPRGPPSITRWSF
jgi:hypothetical protein